MLTLLILQEFILYIDHDALKHLNTQGNVSSRHASWIAFLQQFTFVIKHISGYSNRVDDALSYRQSLLTVLHTSVLGFGSFVDLYTSNPFFGRIYEDSSAGFSSEYAIHDEFLFRGSRLCFPECSLRLQLIYDQSRIHGVATTFVDSLAAVHEQTTANLESSATKYKADVDSHRCHLVFYVGDFVWAVLTRDRMPSHAYNKL